MQKETIMNKIKRKNRIYHAGSIALLGSYTFFIFGVLEIYLTNINEFWFGLKEVLYISLIPCILFASILFFILFIFYNNKFYKYINIFVFSIFISLYIQGNYANASFGVLNGEAIDWGNYCIYEIISIFVWITPLIVGGILVKFIEYTKLEKIINIICICIILVQSITLFFLFITTDIHQNKKDQIVVTDKNLLELAKDKNILVLCLDSFDALEYDELIAESNDYELQDFTYYRNTVGAYPTTVGAVPFILTGMWYENDVIKDDYLKTAFDEAELYKELEKFDYKMGIYTSDSYLSGEIKEKLENTEKLNTLPSSWMKLGKKMYDLVMFKYMPHHFKHYFWFYSEEFNELRKFADRDVSIFSQDMQYFYERLTKENIKIDYKKKNGYKFYHLEGIHPPYTFDEELKNMDGASSIDEAKGNLHVVKEIIGQLKELGIYDQTAIIILADHGHYNYSQNPILLVKEFNKVSNFNISDAPISYEDLLPTLIYYVNGIKTGKTFYDINEVEKRERRYLWYTWTADNSYTADYLPKIDEYLIKGKAYDSSSIFRTPYHYIDGKLICEKEIYEFVDGETVYFDDGENYNSLTMAGFSHNWTLGNQSLMHIDMGSESVQNLVVQVTGTPITPDQEVIVYVNNKYLTKVRDIVDSFELSIPKEYINQQVLEIKFECPKALSPYKSGLSDDRRILSIYIESITFSDVNN